jgi:replication fork clamp-binding protein CrfC
MDWKEELENSFTVVEEVQEAEKFTDFEKVRDEIEERTARLAKSSTGISPIPIIVKVFSPDVTDLTVVDLPGIVKVGIIRSDT